LKLIFEVEVEVFEVEVEVFKVEVSKVDV